MQFNILIMISHISVPLHDFVLIIYRFFSGHTKNPDGTVQFKAGRTRVGDAIDGAIKIFTVAVSLDIGFVLFSVQSV